ncbi:MAG: c-type cytochrome, partial [Chloroflexi bacterium]|nr:c-type cytochrome [Chloroflexota bacterium]
SFIRELGITPNQEGEFIKRCAELCGEKHYAMKATVDVRNSQGYDRWVESQLGECNLSPEECGAKWASVYGCLACHSIDGTAKVGPTWLGLFGASMPMESGDMVIVDEEFLRESIIDPMANIHEGFNPVMPTTFGETLTDTQIEDLIAFIKSLE